MKSNAFWCKRYVTTTASLRSICLNDLYRHQDLWELAVEGDIHGVVSVLQMSVPWMPNRRKRTRSWGKRGDACFLALSVKWYEKVFLVPCFSFSGETAQTLWSAFLSYHLGHVVEELRSVFKVLLLVVMKTKQELSKGTHSRFSSAWMKPSVIVQGKSTVLQMNLHLSLRSVHLLCDFSG